MVRRPRQIETVLVDLDDCAYRVPEIPNLVRQKIEEYMRDVLRIPEETIPELCLDCYKSFGTTMAGLVSKGYKIDVDPWHAYVHHTLPYASLLGPDPKLRRMLNSIKRPKYIFTNADRKHADICLRLMGIQDCFEGVICYESIMAAAESKGISREGIPVLCKPSYKAIELALEQAGHAEAATTLYFDDSTRNVAAGHQAGMFSVLVGQTGADTPSDLQLASLTDLPAALPDLWEHLTEELVVEPASSWQDNVPYKDSLANHVGNAKEGLVLV